MSQTAPPTPWWKNGWTQLALMLTLVVIVRSCLVNHYYVPSGSMEPTLLPGDRVLVDMTAFGVSIPFSRLDVVAGKKAQRGEVVVFGSPKDGTRLIKRVVAVGGDRVSLKGGRLFLNGQGVAAPVSLKEEQLGERRFSLDLRYGGGPDLAEMVIPPGKVLLLGDARGNSKDGRYFGLVEERALYGKATRVFYRRGEGFRWLPL